MPRTLPLLILLATFLIPSAEAAAAPRVWYVDNSRTERGDGSATAPFTALRDAEAASGEGDVINVAAGAKPYGGGFRLKSAQALLGKGGAVVEGTIVLAPAAKIGSLVIRARDLPAVTAEGAIGLVLVGDVVVELEGGDGLVTTDVSGNIAWEGGRIAGVGTALRVTGGSGQLSMRNTPIEVHDALAVSVRSSAMSIDLGSVSDSAAAKRVETAISVSALSGSFSVSGGTIEKMSGRAIAVEDAQNVSLRKVHLVESSANGVSAATCGADAGGADNSGCNAAVYLRKVRQAVLEGVHVSGSAQVGVNGTDIDGLTVAGTVVEHAGNEDNEHAFNFRNLTGKAIFTHVSVRDAASRSLSIVNSGGTAEIEITDGSFADPSSKTGGQGIRVSAYGDARMAIAVRKSHFEHNRGAGFDASATEHASLRVDLEGNTFSGNGAAVALNMKDDAALEYRIVRNDAVRSRGAAISVSVARPSTGTARGTITGNTIGLPGAANSGAVCGSCSGIALRVTGDGRLVAAVTDNTVVQVDGYGIDAAAADGAPSLDAVITGNLIREPASANALSAIHVQSGAGATEEARVCAAIGGAGALGNTIAGEWSLGAITLESQHAGSAFCIAGFAGDGRSTAAVAAYVSSRNGRSAVNAFLASPPAANAFRGGDCDSGSAEPRRSGEATKPGRTGSGEPGHSLP